MTNNLVRKAKNSDAEQIIAVCEANLIANNHHKNAADFAKGGFLMSKVSKQDIEQMIEDSEKSIILVAENNDKICGYLTAYHISKTDELFKEELKKLEILPNDKVLYYKQIAKLPGYVGVGKDLVEKVLVEAKSFGYESVICRIVFEPFYNQASINLHEKSGFKFIKAVKEHNRVAGIYIKDL